MNEFELIDHDGRQMWRQVATGRLAPVIRGASDLGSADEAMMNGGVDTSVDTNAAGIGEGAGQTAQTADTSTDTSQEQERVLTAGQAKALRDENGRYRSEAQRYKQHFDAFDPESQEALLEFISAASNDQAAAAKWAMEYAQAVQTQLQQQQVEAERPMTRAEFQAAMQEREQQQQRSWQEQRTQAQIADINRQVQELGYDTSADWSPENWQRASDTMTLLGIANSVTGGDLQKAHEIMQQRGQQAIGQYVAGRQQDARNSPMPVGGRGGPAASAPQNNGAQGWEAANQQIAAILHGSR